MTDPRRILLLQTAFLGDVILTLPLAQVLRRMYPQARLDMVVLPGAVNVVSGSPAIDQTIAFDKKGGQRGAVSLIRFGMELRGERYDLVITPHRSFRTAVLALLSGAQRRIGFRTSALPAVFTDRVEHLQGVHEVDRNLELLRPLGIIPPPKEPPEIVPDEHDKHSVSTFLHAARVGDDGFIAVAPGSVWNTKRWPASKYAELVRSLESSGISCIVVGGAEDAELAQNILAAAGARRSVSAAGAMTLRQSAELIRRARVLITNDTAPLHLGVAMRTKVIAIFGPTVPSFGFGPYGPRDAVLELKDLSCRPCTKHGGTECPIGTFECMESLEVTNILEAARKD